MRKTQTMKTIAACLGLASVMFVTLLDASFAVGQVPEDAAVKKAEAAAEKATAEKAAAEKALPAKVAAAKAAAEKAATAKTAADKAAAEKAAAEKALAEKTAAAKAAAEKVAAAKAAVEKAAAAKVAAIKAAARKAAAGRIGERKAALDKVAADVTAKDAGKKKAFTDKAIADKIARDQAAAKKAETDKAEAEKALAERDAAAKQAAADVAAAEAAAKKNPDDKSLAQKVTAARTAAVRADRARVSAANTLRSQTYIVTTTARDVDAGKDVLEKIAAAKDGKTPKDAAAARQDAQTIQNFTTAAVTQAIDNTKVVYEQAVVAKAAAERTLTQKIAAAKPAVAKAATAKAAADKTAAARAAAEKVAGDKATAAKAAADKAAADKAAADAALAQQVAAKKVVTEKAAAVTVAANKATADKSAETEAAAAKAVAEKVAADKTLAEKTAAAKTAAGQATAAKKAADAAAAQKAAADKTFAQTVAADKKAASTAASAKAAADQVAAAEKAARDDLRAKDALIKPALAKSYETVALVESGLKLLPADQWDYAKARHLLCRAGFGGTPEEVEKLHAMGLHRAVEFLVNYDAQSGLDLPFNAALPERADPNERQLEFTRRRELIIKRRRIEALQQSRLRDWWMQRMVQSPRPLQEKLVLFWHGHFATEYQTVRDSYAMYLQNELLREHAAGNFGGLLHGIVHDPAMLRYLDNNSNIKGRPNENLAREIMELFSMGEGNYSEEDIMEGARALTGYTYDTNTKQFRFIVSRHDTENKTIFGRTGNYAGDDFVDLILQQPFTSPFIARKLFVFLAHENPSEEVVHRLASLLRGHQYDMRPMLKNLFMSEEFYGEQTMASQIKSPVQLVIGTLRDLGIKDISFSALGSAVSGMGQELFGPPNVKGWEGGQFWVNANRVFVRYNGVADLVERAVVPNKPRGLDVVAALEGQNLKTSEDVVKYLAKSCFVRSLDDAKIKELVNQLGALPPAAEWDSQRNQLNAKLRVLLVLMMSMPEYQCT